MISQRNVAGNAGTSLSLAVPSEGPLTPAEQRTLSALETTIERGLQSFREVGAALLEIRDAGLYREQAHTFNAYCKERWGFNRAHAYRLIDAAGVVVNVSPIGDIPAPANEAQARELSRLEPEQQRAAWERVIATAPKAADGTLKITARHVAETVREVEAAEGPAATDPLPCGEPAAPTFDPASAEPPAPPRDALGREVPEHLLCVWRARERFNEAERLIRAALKTYEEMAEQDAGVRLLQAMPQVRADLRNALKTAGSTRYHTQCPACQASGRACRTCNKSGWITELAFKSLDKDLQQRWAGDAPF